MSGDAWLATIWIYLVGFGAAGVLWFRAVRPILEALGWIAPYTGDDDYVTVTPAAPQDASPFVANEPANEPANERFQPVLMPNGDSSVFPDSFALLAVLVEAEALSVTRAYELLGVSRGSSAAYKEAQQRLAAARLKVSGETRYLELDDDRKPTGRIVGGKKS